MKVLPIVSLLVYSFGIYTFGVLSWYQFRGKAREECHAGTPRARYSPMTDRLGTAIILVSLVWFVVMLLLVLEANHESTWLKTSQLAMLFSFPPLIMHMGYSEALDLNPERVSRSMRFVHRIAWPSSQLLWLGLVLGYLELVEIVPRLLLNPILGISISMLFAITAIHGVVLLNRTKQRGESLRQRSARHWMAGLFVLLLVLVVPSFMGNYGEVLQLVGTSMPLLFMFVGIYHESRFEFFDLFIKRGLSLLITLVLLTAFFALALPGLQRLDLGEFQAWYFTMALAPVVLFIPWLHRRLSGLLDRAVLGRRFATVEAVKHVLSGLHRATVERELVEQAQEGLGTIFQAPVRIVLELTEAPSTDFDCVLQVPIEIRGRRVGVILMGRRANQTPYFSEDRALLSSLGDVFSYTLQNVRLQQKKQEQEQLARELSLSASRSELKALRAQINPHFLFNALNAIAGLIHKDPALADSTVEQLAEVFRYTLRGSEKEWAVIGDEIEFVQAYLEVEKARFGKRLQVEVKLEEQVRSVRVPTMVVQTLVENAIKHGISTLRRPGRVEVVVRARDGMLLIEVADNGPGFTSASDSRKGANYGLKNIRHRLQGYFGDRAELLARRDDDREMTVVSVSIPADHDAASRTGGAA